MVKHVKRYVRYGGQKGNKKAKKVKKSIDKVEWKWYFSRAHKNRSAEKRKLQSDFP